MMNKKVGIRAEGKTLNQQKVDLFLKPGEQYPFEESRADIEKKKQQEDLAMNGGLPKLEMS